MMNPTTSGVTMTSSSTQGIQTVLHPVSDLSTARRCTPPCAPSRRPSESYYVGFEAEGQHIRAGAEAQARRT